jgi:hypothetical protein
MALQVLPLDSDDANYTVDVPLAGSLYRFALFFNTRMGLWTMDIFMLDDTPLVSSIALVADWEIACQFTDLRLPPGFLYCVDTSGAGADPGRDDLGSRVIVVFDDGQ